MEEYKIKVPKFKVPKVPKYSKKAGPNSKYYKKRMKELRKNLRV